MDKLTIGTHEFNIVFFGIADVGAMQIIITDSNVAEIATVFGDATLTAEIVRQHGEEQETYTGFSVLQVIAPMENGIRVSMRRKYVGE